MKTTRSERYDVRPFVGINSVASVLNGVTLTVGAEIYPAGYVVIDEPALLNDSLTLALPDAAAVKAALQGTVLSPIDCAMVVLVSARTHRFSQVILSQYLQSGTYEPVFSLDRTVAPLAFEDTNGFTITAAVVLLHDLVEVPLQPHLSGTWLARCDFQVAPERDETAFSPEVLTPEVRQLFELPAATSSFVHVEQSILLEVDVLSDAVQVYVSDDILRLLQQSQTETLSLLVQSQLASSTMSSVARSALRALRDHWQRDVVTVDDLSASAAVLRYFESLARVFDTDLAEIIDLAGDPERLDAFLSSSLEIRKLSVSALRATTGALPTTEEA